MFYLPNTIVIDTETTGLNPSCDELLQVSIIDDSGHTIYDQYIKPIYATEWQGAERVNHISPEFVKDCPTIKDELPIILPIIKNAKTIIGYNTHFDLAFLSCVGCIISPYTKIVDVMSDFAPIYGEWSDKYSDYKWQKLITCAEYYGYDWKNDTAHNSLADCRATLFCYKKMQEEV